MSTLYWELGVLATEPACKSQLSFRCCLARFPLYSMCRHFCESCSYRASEVAAPEAALSLLLARLSPARNVPLSTAVLPRGRAAPHLPSLFSGLSGQWLFAGQCLSVLFRPGYLCCFMTPKHQVCEICIFSHQ